MAMMLPAAAGFAAVFSVVSWLNASASPPAPGKRYGAAGTTWKLTELLAPHAPATVSVAVPGSVSYGICTLICPGLAKKNGTGVSLILTVEPAKLVGSGTEFTFAVVSAISLPKIETSDPGATGPAAKLAPFTTPPAATDGTAVEIPIRARNASLGPP